MKNTNTKINGQVISLEYDHHYNNIYCVDIYVNGSFKRTGNIDKATSKLILAWIGQQFNEALVNGNCLCLAVYNGDGQGDHRIKMFERLGFTKQGPLYYKG